jgi:hypothetical protein
MDADKVVQQIDWFRKQTRSGIANRPRQVRLLNLQKKEKKGKQSLLRTSPLTQDLLSIFTILPQKQGNKTIYQRKDGKNLKRVLELNILTENELQQLRFIFWPVHTIKVSQSSRHFYRPEYSMA